MELNEFRIGNYLIDQDGRICKVEAIKDTKKLEYCYETGISASPMFGGLTKLPLKPIKITGERLDELGFANRPYKVYYKNLPNQRKISLSLISNKITLVAFVWVDESQELVNLYIRDCFYVHQLQNIFFILTGLELRFEKSIKKIRNEKEN